MAERLRYLPLFTLAVAGGIVAKYLFGYSVGTAIEAALMMMGGILAVILIITRERKS
jgi:hypothetical protein